MNEANPWLAAARHGGLPPTPAPGPEGSASAAIATVDVHPPVTGAVAPQQHVSDLTNVDALPVRTVTGTATVWVVGAHGGAGESTLAAHVDDWQPTGHAWPAPDSAHDRRVCILTARTNVTGLLAAQRALTQWAAGGVVPSTTLAGLVLIADAPGRLPKPLRDLVHHVSGGAPRTWPLGWIEEWRLGEDVPAERRPRALRDLVTDLTALSAVSGNH